MHCNACYRLECQLWSSSTSGWGSRSVLLIMKDKALVLRTPEIEEASNLYIVHPLSRLWVDQFVRLGVDPNTVSVLGMLSALAAAVCYYHYHLWYMSVLGFLFMVGWHIFDGADGQLARLTGKSTELGKTIDGLCDQLGFLSVYLAITLAVQPEYGWWVWLLCFAAAISHLVQASSLEFQRDFYDCWIHQKKDKCPLSVDEFRQNVGRYAGLRKLLTILHLIYIRIQYHFAEPSPALLALERQSRYQAQRRSHLDAIYRLHCISSVHKWTWLSANKRTIAIALACLFKAPLLFFVYEIVVLNVVLLWLKREQRNLNSFLAREMDGVAEEPIAG